MPRTLNKKAKEAKELYLKGLKLIEIAEQLKVPEGTVRSWKNRGKWNATLQTDKRNVAKKRGAPLGNKNATGPPGNKHAEKYGFFAKHLPEETLSIIQEIDKKNLLDIRWENIQIQYAAIIRAQQIMYVKDKKDKTKSKVGEKHGNVSGEEWEIQYAWDKQANFIQAQSQAMKTLDGMIKQYDEMLHKNWDLATEEQKTRIDAMKSKIQSNDADSLPPINFIGIDDVKE